MIMNVCVILIVVVMCHLNKAFLVFVFWWLVWLMYISCSLTMMGQNPARDHCSMFPLLTFLSFLPFLQYFLCGQHCGAMNQIFLYWKTVSH